MAGVWNWLFTVDAGLPKCCCHVAVLTHSVWWACYCKAPVVFSPPSPLLVSSGLVGFRWVSTVALQTIHQNNLLGSAVVFFTFSKCHHLSGTETPSLRAGIRWSLLCVVVVVIFSGLALITDLSAALPLAYAIPHSGAPRSRTSEMGTTSRAACTSRFDSSRLPLATFGLARLRPACVASSSRRFAPFRWQRRGWFVVLGEASAGTQTSENLRAARRQTEVDVDPRVPVTRTTRGWIAAPERMFSWCPR